jgi:hypothetical protein
LQEIYGHVREENKITPYELFLQVYKRDPTALNIFERQFYWNLITKALHYLRRKGSLFVINKGSYLFVLKTYKESNNFKNRLSATIQALEQTKLNADKWVKEEKYKEFEKKKFHLF